MLISLYFIGHKRFELNLKKKNVNTIKNNLLFHYSFDSKK